MPDLPGAISLSELVQQTADELRKVKHQAPKDGAVLEFKECELELAVTFSGEGGAGLKFWIVSTEAKVSAEQVSKIKLSFSAVEGSRVQAAAKRAGPAKKPIRRK